MLLVGPFALRLAFHTFVVLVGVLILSGAVNTAIIGSNGVLNRVAEDGVLPRWLGDPHPKYGTTYRTINVIVGLQLATILISRGDVYILGEAYAFGVVWSFAMKALAVVILRFTQPRVPRCRVPLNFHVKSIEVPLGLLIITTVLFLLAGINVLTKKTATMSGMAFTVVLFIVFTICERRQKHKKREEERFRFKVRDHLSTRSLPVRSGNILVAVHDPNNLDHLEKVLEKNDPKKSDVVVLSVNPNGRQDVRTSEDVIDQCETRIFSSVVHLAEKIGKPVSMVAVPGKDSDSLILQAAEKLHSSRVVRGTRVPTRRWSTKC
jgi:hypothetical protein